jgi:hypothetical protein
LIAAMLASIGGTAFLVAPTLAATCHIHPPPTESDPSPALIGPWPDAGTCDVERANRFGALGRCHCTAAFTPGWLSDDPSEPTAAGQRTGMPRAFGTDAPLP